MKTFLVLLLVILGIFLLVPVVPAVVGALFGILATLFTLAVGVVLWFVWIPFAAVALIVFLLGKIFAFVLGWCVFLALVVGVIWFFCALLRRNNKSEISDYIRRERREIDRIRRKAGRRAQQGWATPDF